MKIYLFSLISCWSPQADSLPKQPRPWPNGPTARISIWPGPVRFHHFGQNAALPMGESAGPSPTSQQKTGINHGSKAIMFEYML